MIDLSALPPPAVIESLDFETIFELRKSRLLGFYPEDERLEMAARLALESEPMTKLLQENSYQELILRQRINDAARAVLLPYAEGSDLDNAVVRYDVQRLDNETDAALLRRALLSLHALSVAGPSNAYKFHALSAHPAVHDASATRPSPGKVLVTLLLKPDTEAAPEDVLSAVYDALNADDVRPLSDTVKVQLATLVEYQIDATLHLEPGAPKEILLGAALSQLENYARQQHVINGQIHISAVYAALQQAGVSHADLCQPASAIITSLATAPVCTGIFLRAADE